MEIMDSFAYSNEWNGCDMKIEQIFRDKPHYMFSSDR